MTLIKAVILQQIDIKFMYFNNEEGKITTADAVFIHSGVRHVEAVSLLVRAEK